MGSHENLLRKITDKHGHILDLRKNPKILEDIIIELKSIHDKDFAGHKSMIASKPFGISWMDSWAALWMINQKNNSDPSPEKEFNGILKQLVDLKFKDRLSEIKKFISEHLNEPPDGGPPEPGVPPDPGPAPTSPEPGVPPEPPDGGTPEPPDGGTPEPGIPPDPPDPGPDSGFLNENPWILYWFVSIRASFILDMIDAHFTRRINDLKSQGNFNK